MSEAVAVNSGVFNTLVALDVNKHTEKKRSGSAELTYLSWPWAWEEVKKRYPDARYNIHSFNGLPYVHDPMTGYMVFTDVTIDGVTHDMWLPVMDGNNRAMKSQPYTIAYGQRNITVQPATMFDINKTIMRCLVKNLAMFGLGLYIYAGEDLPSSEQAAEAPAKQSDLKPFTPPANTAAATVTKAEKVWNFKDAMDAYCKAHNMAVSAFAAFRKALIAGGVVDDIPSRKMTKDDAEHLFKAIEQNYPQED